MPGRPVIAAIALVLISSSAAHAGDLAVPELAPPAVPHRLRLELDATTVVGADPVSASSGALLASYRARAGAWVLTADAGAQLLVSHPDEPLAITAPRTLAFTNLAFGVHRWFGPDAPGGVRPVFRAVLMVPTAGGGATGGNNRPEASPAQQLRITAMPWSRTGPMAMKLALGLRVARGRWAAQGEAGADLSLVESTDSSWLSGQVWLGAGAAVELTRRVAMTGQVVARTFPRAGVHRQDEGVAAGLGAALAVGRGELSLRGELRVDRCAVGWDGTYGRAPSTTGTCGRIVAGYQLALD